MATYKPLEPNLTEVVGTTLNFNIDSTSLSSMTGSIFILMVSACLLAGMVMFAYAGFLYVKADSQPDVQGAKKVLKNAAFGVIGVLGMYLLLDQINPEMLRGDLGLKPIPSTGTSQTGSQSQTSGASSGAQSGSSSGSVDNTISTNEAEAAARKKLVGVGVNKTYPSTQIQGLPDKVINMANDLKAYCNCSVVITGGTEPGHKSHGKNLNVVDLRCSSGGSGCGTDDLSNFIRTNGAKRTPKSFCYEEYYYNGFNFCNEKNSDVHWHVYETNY